MAALHTRPAVAICELCHRGIADIDEVDLDQLERGNIEHRLCPPTRSELMPVALVCLSSFGFFLVAFSLWAWVS
jgi:hypothetical protein